MTPQEKELIQGVFDRLAAHKDGGKDAEAEALIRDNMQRQPDAAYGLVQAVVMLEAGLNQAQARIAELQRQPTQTPPSFLGGQGPWGGGSVPRSAPQPAPQAAYQPQPTYFAPPPPQPMASPWAVQPSGGGFLRNAAMMAAGVAGGSLIAEGIESMLSGRHYGGGYGYGGGFGGGFGGGYGGPGEVVEQVTVNNYYDDRAGGGEHEHHVDQASLQDASYDDASDYSDDSGSYDDGVDI